MSLDVYLQFDANVERDKWDDRHEVYWANITHNLTAMADVAGIYEVLWQPEQLGFDTAEQLIPLLVYGLEQLKADPEKFSQYNSPNGWGKYEHFVLFVKKYLEACREYPKAKIHVSR